MAVWCVFDNGLIRILVAYNIFYMAGYLFYKNLELRKIVSVGVLLLLILLWMVFDNTIYVVPMQSHKEQVDFVFVIYGLFALLLLSLLFRKVSVKPYKILSLWNERGYTIYLYQNLVYFAFFPIFLKWISKWESVWLQFTICSASIFIMSTLLSFGTYKLEKVLMGKLYG